MKYVIAFALLAAMGCGPYKVELEQKDPIVVQHKLDLADLQKYFKVKCEDELAEKNGTIPTQLEIDDCVTHKIADFLEVIK
jgi:hypothetical protein